jgi:hypothetical protein
VNIGALFIIWKPILRHTQAGGFLNISLQFFTPFRNVIILEVENISAAGNDCIHFLALIKTFE